MILGLGVDLCEVYRIEKLLAKDRPRFLRRVYTEEEATYCLQRRSPAVHLAARFAAKEAFMKAIGSGWRLGWRQVEVIREPGGKPSLKVFGKAALVLDRLHVESLHLSLTHTREHAIAIVVLEGNAMRGLRDRSS